MLLRLLAETASAPGSTAERDVSGNWRFPVGAGSIEPITLDYSGWLGLSDSISTSTWAADGVTLAGQAVSGTSCTARATIPTSSTSVPDDRWPEAYKITHTVLATSGKKRITDFYLVAS